MSQHKLFTPIRSAKKTLSNRESAKISLSLSAPKNIHFDKQCKSPLPEKHTNDVFVNQNLNGDTTLASKTKVQNDLNYEQIEYDPYFEDSWIYEDARRLSSRFEASQVTRSLDPNKWTPCSSKKALKNSRKPKADAGKTKKGTDLSETFAKLTAESSS